MSPQPKSQFEAPPESPREGRHHAPGAVAAGASATTHRALTYLWLTLLKRRLLRFGRGLRRPTTLIGVTVVSGWIGCLFYFRHEPVYGELVRPASLVGGALVMLFGSVFKGFLQRGLVFEPADLEFIFPGPFSQRQVIQYRLLPQYLFAVVQAVVFGFLFAPHLPHPFLAAACLALFQGACFHLATLAAIWGGSLPLRVHDRIRWMMLVGFFVVGALYLKVALGIRLLPQVAQWPLAELGFYPAVNLADVANAPVLHAWTATLGTGRTAWTGEFGPALLYVGGFAAAALVSLRALLRLNRSVFETSLETTTRAGERAQRLREGRTLASGPRGARSVRLPRSPWFRGAGAIVWKQLVVARRSRRELVFAFAFTSVYTILLTGLVWEFHRLNTRTPELAATAATQEALYTARSFYCGVALFIGVLAFFLQRIFPFDFRREGPHLPTYRTLPVRPLALALAELSVPVGCILLCQVVGLAPLFVYGWSQWPLLLLLALGYPAVALALNTVWNLHYLLSASRQAAGRAESPSAVGTVMVVAFSFLIFFPAVWTANHVERYVQGDLRLPAMIGSGLVVQYGIDLVAVLLLARLFQKCETTREG